jgi:hypothetical protein
LRNGSAKFQGETAVLRKNGESRPPEDALNHEPSPHFPEAIWTTSQTKALLNLPRAPKHLLKREPWAS